MNLLHEIYCLDSNTLIEAWEKYYSPKYCPGYWDVLNSLGAQKRIFIAKAVFDEITRTDDDLSKWLKTSKIPVRKVDGQVTSFVTKILAAHPHLVDSTKGRSLADPWVIAHAMSENACVVTKEEKVTASNSKKIKIPNVCENMSVRWINDFQLIEELNIKFTCQIPQP